MNNLDLQYKALLNDILINGIKKQDRTNTGTLSVFGRTIRHNMSEGFPILTSKKVFFKGVIGELLWMLSGDTNIKYLCDNDINIWAGDAYKNYENKHKVGESYFTKEGFIEKIKNSSSFAKQWGELGPVYGASWRRWKTHIDPYTGKNLPNGVEFEIDQLTNLINKLKNKPDDRRLIVMAWNPAVENTVTLPPCHYNFQCYTRELSIGERLEQFKELYPNKSIDDFAPGGMEIQSLNHQMTTRFDNANISKRSISLLVNIRSWDVFLGGPFNIASYGLLLSLLGKEVNMIPDELIINTGDTHLYSNHIDAVMEQLEQTIFELPKLSDLYLNPNKGIFEYEIEDIVLNNYNYSKSIKAPLSN